VVEVVVHRSRETFACFASNGARPQAIFRRSRPASDRPCGATPTGLLPDPLAMAPRFVHVAVFALASCDAPRTTVEAEPAEPSRDDAPATTASEGDASTSSAPATFVEPTPTPTPVDAVPPSTAELALERPPGFGTIRPELPVPKPEELTVHALAGFEVVAIHMRPDLESPRLGYLRMGQRTMVTAKLDDQDKECPKGFYGLPAGGFACASKGLLVDATKEPYMYLPPLPPRIDRPIPYDYGVIASDGTPLWWRMADADEIRLATQRYEAEVAAAAPADTDPNAQPDANPDANPDAPKPAPTKKKKAGPRMPGEETPDDEPLPDVDDAPPPELTPEEIEKQKRHEAAERKRAEAQAEGERERAKELARKAARLPLSAKSPFLEAGMVITLGEKVKDDGRSWWRTTRGAFVQSHRAWRKEPTDFHGGEVPAGATSFGFVIEDVASASAIAKRGKLEWKRKLGFRELLVFTAQAEVGGHTYLVTADGLHVRNSDMRMARPATRPEEVRPYERWIDVDLERQLLVAYDGDVPVYATLVSTGKKGTAEESFLTPAGKFRITTKHVSSSMDGDTASDGAYSIQDVPWAMFFHGSYALHGAFWHSKFGSRRSHGCVNLGPTDARWLFNWTMPFVPQTWHGVAAHPGAPGSMVVVH